MNELLLLQLEVETLIIAGGSSRVTADEIVELVSETIKGNRKPQPSEPWKKFAVGKPT